MRRRDNIRKKVTFLSAETNSNTKTIQQKQKIKLTEADIFSYVHMIIANGHVITEVGKE